MNEVHISDIGESTFLLVKGETLLGFRDIRPRIGAFVFEDSPTLSEQRRAYLNDDLIPVQSFFNRLRMMRGLIHEERKQLGLNSEREESILQAD